ncbi:MULTISPECIES: hypothetical protein [unclassified Streptomyces]|uniref:hypothetical protein n=1 Tax=unclassified Streptomyces TaxID=2593676 RepID=UPI003D8F2A36
MSEIYADTMSVPPRAFLPKPVHKFLDARDAAYERFVDYESEHAELLMSNWEAVAIARDEAAGAAAMADGRNPLDEPSHLEAAQRQRPRVLGALRTLAAEVRKADAALKAAVRRELPAIEQLIEADVSKVASTYIDAQAAADAARQVYGAALTRRAWVTNWAKLGLYTECPDVTEAAPVTASEGPAVDVYGRPIDRGAAEVRAIDESYGHIQPKPTRAIRSRVNGAELEIDAHHAAALVGKGQAEYVDEVAA